MSTEVVLITPEKLEAIIESKIEEALKKHIPKAIRQASRKEWLTTNDLMEYLNCSRRTAQYLRDAGKITFS